jgi:hypothetical protein
MFTNQFNAVVMLNSLENLQLRQKALDCIFPHAAYPLKQLASKFLVADCAEDLVDLPMSASTKLTYDFVRKRLIL